MTLTAYDASSQSSSDTICLPKAQLLKAVSAIEEGKVAKEELAQQRANNTLSEERIRVKDSSISELTLKGQTLERLVRNREDAVANLNSRIENLDKSINLYKKAQRRQRSYKWFAGAVGVAAGILIGKL